MRQILFSNHSSRNLTVYALLISKSLALLCLVPVEDQTIPERQSGSSICSRFIAIEQRASKGGLDVTDSLFVELIRCGERLGHLWLYQYPTLHYEATPQSRYSKDQLTYKLPPGFTLWFWDAVLDSLDLAWAEAGHGPLVLGASEVCRPNGSLEVSKRGAGRGTTFPWRR